MAGFFFNQPAIGGADAAWAGGFAFEQEGGSVAHLGDGCVDAEVPDSRGDEVVAFLEVGGKIKALVAPVGEVAASGAVTDAMTVGVEDKAVVGAYADDVSGGDRRQIDGTAEMED